MRHEVTRYYIAQGEKFWNGSRFSCLMDDCKVYNSKSAASKCLTKLANSGQLGELKESRYLI